MKGYEALRKTAAWLNFSGRGEIKLTGEDRARLLHAMTTNHIQQLRPGQGCYAFFLNAQGRILADVNVLCRPDHFLLDTEPETREKVYEHLDKFIIADDAVLEDVTTAMLILALEGPQSREVLQATGAPVPEEPYVNSKWGTRLVARLSYTGGPGYTVFAPASEMPGLIEEFESCGAQPADPEAFNVVRLENGKPHYGQDLSERFLAQEANQPHALNFNKGCYLGQEIVERVRSRGQIHRVLMPLQLDLAEPPTPGSKLQVEDQQGKTAAEITSAAFSPALNKTVALAYVRTEYTNRTDFSLLSAASPIPASEYSDSR